MIRLSTLACCLSLAAGDDPAEPALSAERLYYGLGQPVMVTVGPLRAASRNVTLVLMDAQGMPVAPPRDVVPGRIDLAEVLPEIWSVRRTCYVQRIDDHERRGSALVVQPLIEQGQPRTEQAKRPDGTAYTRIAGWEPAQPAAFSGLRVYPEQDVLLVTSKGDIVLAMRPDEAPNTAWNFRHLVEGGFYNGVAFHRIVPMARGGHPFVIQAGDPGRTGDGGVGYRLPMEPSALAHDFGVVSMARADHPDSAGSQFFICLSREGTARLDGQYCAFGCAVAGADTIRAIASVKLADAAAGRPEDPPVIQWAELVPAPSRVPGLGRPDLPLSEQKSEEPPAPPPRRPPR